MKDLPSEARFQFIAGNLALDFTNTVGDRLAPQPGRDYLSSVADVVEWMRAANIDANGAPRPARAREGDLDRIRTMRERLYRIFTAGVDGRPPAPPDLRALNDSVHEARARQRMVASGGRLSWAWAWEASVTPVDRALFTIALEAAALLTSPSRAQIRRCADDRCGWLFLDESRGARRRWCSMADCGNRNKARRHYQRARA